MEQFTAPQSDCVKTCAGPWQVECLPGDGARLSRLAFNGHDLLTGPPPAFQPPRHGWGAYETRPVYGYDDCMPTVDPCRHPAADWDVPDHGELCWLPWRVRAGAALDCRVRSRRLPITFRRRLEFDGPRLAWRFEVRNEGAAPVLFQHVMHALMPPEAIAALRLPDFETAFDEIRRAPAPIGTPAAAAASILNLPRGHAAMLLLRKVKDGRVTIRFQDGLLLRIQFPADMFPTLGIWWNRSGYPDEDNCRRSECAFEPIPGPGSSLADAAASKTCLVAPPRSELAWRVTWECDAPAGAK